MKPVKVSEDIYWVGAVDWNIRDFHGYATYEGTTYNAYLILDEKITLIDTVKKEFTDQMMKAIGELTDPKKIDYVISNHTEMDHSGGLPLVMHVIGGDKPVYCSKMGLKNLAGHFGERFNLQAVDKDFELNLGRKTLVFMETRMAHWPDSMFSYVKEDDILFSSDAFGQHYAGWERFDDQVGDAIMPHALKYYANILLPYSPRIAKLIVQVAEAGLNPKIICPDHGIIWRENPTRIVEAYARWAEQKPSKKAVVVYDTMWESTRKMAEAIVDGLIAENVETRCMRLRTQHRSDVITEIMEAGAVLVGSPTLNNGLFPTVSDFLCYMKGLRPKNKIAAAFGSYGWTGESVKLITQELEAMKLDIIDPGLSSHWVPDDEGLKKCFELGQKAGQALARMGE
jgi:flavorubredoxin